ncbi:MAG: phosphopantetheine-binding protein [Planctomycetia bacterium]|nr:phosphopantetheine-binding protein [Planctomycetia bacterium]
MNQGMGKIFYFDATEVRRQKMRQAAAEKFVVKSTVLEEKPRKMPESKEVVFRAEERIVAVAETPSVEPVKAEPKVQKVVAASPTKSELESLLVNFVVEQTGYPEEMVDMEADLEGDLGIDSIKKAQLLGELNEKFHFVDTTAQADSDMTLDDFPTLGTIRDYLLEKVSGASAPVSAAVKNPTVTGEKSEEYPAKSEVKESVTEPVSRKVVAVMPTKSELESLLVNFVVEQTGYPEEMVDMEADLEGDLGIDSIKKAQLLGELNEKFHFVDTTAQADSDMTLDDFPTLGTIRDYLLEKVSGTSAPVSEVVKNPTVTGEKSEECSAKSEVKESSSGPALQQTSAVMPTKSELESLLVNFVVEQTGYPEEMVDMEADLEGDLGIDSIKKAQLLGELNEKFHFVDTTAQADSDMTLDDFPTLGTIRDYLLEKIGGTNSSVSAAVKNPTVPVEDSGLDENELADFFVNFVVEQTGYPVEMVSLDADLQTELNIDSIKKAQLFAELAEVYNILPLMDMSLEDFKTLRDILDACMK